MKNPARPLALTTLLTLTFLLAACGDATMGVDDGRYTLKSITAVDASGNSNYTAPTTTITLDIDRLAGVATLTIDGTAHGFTIPNGQSTWEAKCPMSFSSSQVETVALDGDSVTIEGKTLAEPRLTGPCSYPGSQNFHEIYLFDAGDVDPQGYAPPTTEMIFVHEIDLDRWWNTRDPGGLPN